MKLPTRRESMLRLTANQEYSSFYDEGDLPTKKPWSSRLACCCTSAMGAAFCAIFTIFFLAGVAVAIFLVYPRIPTITFRDLTYRNGNAVVADSLSQNSRLSDGVVTIPLGFNLDIKSENFYDISIIRADVSGTMNDKEVGDGNLDDPLIIKSRDLSHILFPFQLKINTTDASPSNLSLLKTLFNSCSSDPSHRKSLSIQYQVKLTLQVLSWSQAIPDINRSIDFPCPWDLTPILPEAIRLALTGTNPATSSPGPAAALQDPSPPQDPAAVLPPPAGI